jgi:hypothetical protein
MRGWLKNYATTIAGVGVLMKVLGGLLCVGIGYDPAGGWQAPGSIAGYLAANVHFILIGAGLIVAADAARFAKFEEFIRGVLPKAKLPLVLLCLLCASAVSARAQMAASPSMVGAGASFNQQVRPPVTGLAWGLLDLTPNNYNIWLMDITSKNFRPFVVDASVSTGIARDLHQFGGTHILGLVAVGASASGTNLGWTWTGGAMAPIPLKPGSKWSIVPLVRIYKSSLGDYQPMLSVTLGLKL